MCFDPKSMTLDGPEWSLCTLFQNTCSVVLLLIYTVSHSVCFYAVDVKPHVS